MSLLSKKRNSKLGIKGDYMEKIICSQCGKEIDRKRERLVYTVDNKIICNDCADEWV